MTGYLSSKFRHRCPRDGCYVKSLPSWDYLIECFPRGIRPTDIDGMVEINDHFLFLEEKKAGESMTGGQRYAMKALASRERVTVLMFRPGATSDLEVIAYGNGMPGVIEAWTQEQFLNWIRSWVAVAEGVTVA